MNGKTELSAALALGWSLLVTCGLVSVAMVVGMLLGNSNWAMIVAAPAEVLVMLPATKLVARFYGEREQRRSFGLGAAPPLELLIGASLGVLLQLPAGYLSSLVERRFPLPPEAMHAQLAALTPTSAPIAVLMLLSVALLVPFIEELFYRGALFSALLRSGPAFVAIWTTSIAFVLAHQEPRNWAPLLLVALVLGELRRRGRSIWAGVALHAAFNATTLLSVFVTHPSELKPESSPWQQAVLGGALCGLGVWLFGRVSGRRLAEAS